MGNINHIKQKLKQFKARKKVVESMIKMLENRLIEAKTKAKESRKLKYLKEKSQSPTINSENKVCCHKEIVNL